ncbi:hypothetical protein CDQ84_07425 [Clostridium thermosuccinogenes]|uniref:Hcy-binding domain-containing protein n=1 Tax=Clostridium thermosuccinogenes TaxID=84032 RepID=A0A2K2FGU8_9CLOT|nr:hypothetical protein CDO33_09125 [Pseudoclostridium thermosuccinogenes]PNT98021.1 hypothetical protein CDQ85_06925 [Pseudoclostridium thermosuccinogenes]PNU00041.1 hypothetical protein CDQ84_07425 [Pseudoclostridium thermosuccinogenes]
MDLKDFLTLAGKKVLIYDGSKGTMLQKFGMSGGECPELWNIEHSDVVKKIYSMYKEAGSDVIQTNTFQGNRLKLEQYSLADKTYELNYEGARLAREVMGKDGFVAASIGPIGKLFEPSGELTFEKAYDLFKEQVRAVADGGVDLINFETFTDIAELRAALLAAKEETDLPVICSVAFEANGRTLMGTDPYTAAVVLKSLGADMIGTNCSLGPEHLLDIVKAMSKAGGIPLAVKPNAGLPETVDGNVVYKETPERFSSLAEEYVKSGVRLIGGCCGTTPDFIKALRERIDGIEVPEIQDRAEKVISSGVKTLSVDGLEPADIGFIDARKDTGLLEELKNADMDAVADRAMDLSCDGYTAVYINIDGAEGDEKLLAQVANTLQSYVREPFILETCNAKALDYALRLYKGKAGVIIPDTGKDNIEELLKTAGKYGSTVLDRGILG